MKKNSLKILISFIIYVIVILISVSKSNAPFRVHFVNATALLIGFFIPSLFISSFKMMLNKWYLPMTFILLSVFIWDYLSAEVILKREFLMNALILYPVSIIFLIILLIIHRFLVQYALKRE